jgi:hypothetical protein
VSYGGGLRQPHPSLQALSVPGMDEGMVDEKWGEWEGKGKGLGVGC